MIMDENVWNSCILLEISVCCKWEFSNWKILLEKFTGKFAPQEINPVYNNSKRMAV